MNPPDSGAAATSAMTGAIRTESRKKSSGAIAKRACDQCKFRKIKASNILRFLRTSFRSGVPLSVFLFLSSFPGENLRGPPVYFDLTVFPSLAGRANRLSNCSVVYPNHAGHVFPWALNAPFFNRRRNVVPLDSESECLPGS